MKKIVVVGSSNMDLVIRTNTFPRPGETVMGSDFMTNFGGKGANQAVAAALLGGDVAFVAKVGNDSYGKEMIEKFRNDGIDTSAVTTTNATSTGIAIITVDANGENNIVVASGANAMLTEEDIRSHTEMIAQADILLMQLETPIPTLIAAAEIAHQHGTYVVLNPAPAPKEPLPLELLRNVNLIIPNETEASILTGIATDEADATEKMMNHLMNLGIDDVIMTIGARGALYMLDGKVTLVPSQKVKAVDTTAAGDTFCGALCVGMAEGMSRREAIEFACKAAAYTVCHKGAQCAMPRREAPPHLPKGEEL